MADSTWLLLVVSALAAARVTRLVTSDTITEPVRRRLCAVRRTTAGPSIERPRLWRFLTCPWCVGVWISAAVVLLAVVEPRGWWRDVALVLAIAEVVGILGERF